jgi:hypothetical protein
MAFGNFCARVPALTVAVALALAAGMLVILAPTAVAGSPPCQAENVRTGTEYTGASALATAIADAAAGDTIKISGTCFGNFAISKDLTLRGQGGKPTLDGAGTGRVLQITDGTTTIDGLTITHGIASDDVGGGIHVNGETAGAHVVNSLVTGNSAGIFGGGIDVDLGTLTLVNSTVSRNTSSSAAGIDTDFGTVTLIRSTVSGNVATGGGTCTDADLSCAGGLWNFGGTVTLIDSLVSGNTADNRGGGMVVQLDQAVLTLSGSTRIVGNKASEFGGGIWIRDNPTISATADWTGAVTGNKPDQCFPQVTIGSTTCGA